MAAKSEQLQIRVTPAQKTALKRHARAAGVDVSTWVLARVLPPEERRFAGILRALLVDDDRRLALAELNDFLHDCTPLQFQSAVAQAAVSHLPLFAQNYVAAMVEHAAAQKHVAPPSWVRDVAPLPAPYFASGLRSLRMPLLQASPVPFKRRNLFVDAAVGARV